MMMLSGVWFSLEGAPETVVKIANIFPLTHILDSARAVMLDGATLVRCCAELIRAYRVMSAVFLRH